MANFETEIKDQANDNIPKRIAALEIVKLLNYGKFGVIWSIAGCLLVQILFKLNFIIASIGFVVFCGPMLYGLIYIQKQIVYYKEKYNV